MNRITKIFMVAALLVAPFTDVVAEKSPEALKPKAVIKDPVFDFDTVSEGVKVIHDFKIKNEGKADLRIDRIVPGCGCTASNASQNVVAPGQETTIHVEFDTTGFSGEKVKSVRIYTNDPNESTLLLTIRGQIERDIVVQPSRVFFGDIRKGAAASEEVKVSVREGAQARIEEISSFSPYIELEFKSKTPTLNEFIVKIKPDAPSGELRSRVVVNLSGKGTRAINIPIYASVKSKIELSPAAVSYGVFEPGQDLNRKVKLENYGAPIEIDKIEVSDTAVSTSIKEIKKGSIYILNVNVDPTKVRGTLKSVVKIKTDSPEQEELSLNVYGITPPRIN